MKLTLSIPGFGNIDSELPKGVPTGELFGTGQDAIRVFINLVLVVAIFVALYFIGYGAVDMITSEGEKEKMKRGRERVIYAGLGLIVIFLSFTAMNILTAFFGIDFLCLLKSASSCK